MPFTQAAISFLCGVLATKLYLPFRVIWNEDAVVETVKTARRFTQFIGDTFSRTDDAAPPRTIAGAGGVRMTTLASALTAIRDADEDDDEEEEEEEPQRDRTSSMSSQLFGPLGARKPRFA